MLYTRPPGQVPSTMNRQTVGGLSVPGFQTQAPVTPGSTYVPGGPSIPPQQGTSSYSQPSSFSQPSSVPSMNQWNGSQNMSTLLRTLLGNTTTGKKYG